jgi:hypothetical protein
MARGASVALHESDGRAGDHPRNSGKNCKKYAHGLENRDSRGQKIVDCPRILGDRSMYAGLDSLGGDYGYPAVGRGPGRDKSQSSALSSSFLPIMAASFL